jgi:beta-glucosidase
VRDMRFSTGAMRIGVSTSALQIEGGDQNNNWYAWAQQPGTIADGSSPDRATDHWKRWREDTTLMADLGLQVYRLGVEWSRIEPRDGEFDRAALIRYREELQALRDNGIEPLVTLHHFTNPLWFQELGEWTDSRSVDRFVRFTRVVVEAFGDLVSEWVTINEPNVYAAQCHLFKEGPPGDASYAKVRKTLRHMAIAHCTAYDAIHQIQPHAKVGVAHHLRVFAPLNAGNPIHRTLTRVSDHLFQGALTDAILGGRFRSFLGPQPATVTPGKYYDYLGINYYSRTAVSKIGDGTFAGVPVNDLGWEIYAHGIVQVAGDLHGRYPGPIWVTENGTCDNGDEDRVERFRSRYIHDHLAAIAGSGLPFERYYHWCFVDNWEWGEGMSARFGIVHLDPETLNRMVKPSGRFLARVIADGGVSDAAYAAYVADESYRVG